MGPEGFPRIRILHPSVADKLLEMIAREVCEGGLPGVPVWNLSQNVPPPPAKKGKKHFGKKKQ